MKKITLLICIIMSAMLLIGFAGCTKIDGNTGISIEENADPQVEDNASIKESFHSFIEENHQLNEIIAFIDENIANSDEETANEMVNYLIDTQETNLAEESQVFYDAEQTKLQQDIANAATNPNLSSIKRFVGQSKYDLLNAISETDSQLIVQELFAKGYGFLTAEGMFNPIVDYPEVNEKYSEFTTGMTKEYLAIMSEASLNPSTVEEYLSIEADELAARLAKYESFLHDYPNAAKIDYIQNMYLEGLWKLLNPSLIDNTMDGNGNVDESIVAAHQKLAADVQHPITAEIISEIQVYMQNNNYVFATTEKTDDLYETAQQLYNTAKEKIVGTSN